MKLVLSLFCDLSAGKMRLAIKGMLNRAKRDMLLVAPYFIMMKTQKMLPRPSLR